MCTPTRVGARADTMPGGDGALALRPQSGPGSTLVDVETIDPKTFDLSVKNPNGGEEIAHRSPQEIMDEIAALDAESAEVLGNIKALL